MAYLLDTNILFRLVSPNDPQHTLTRDSLSVLEAQGEILHLTAQNFIEFRNGTTRPNTMNGLGLSAKIAAQEAAKFEAAFSLLAETPAIYPAWKTLADSSGITGKQVHDARLVAVCHVHSISHLLTFNGPHFMRFQNIGAGITIVHPKDV